MISTDPKSAPSADLGSVGRQPTVFTYRQYISENRNHPLIVVPGVYHSDVGWRCTSAKRARMSRRDELGDFICARRAQLGQLLYVIYVSDHAVELQSRRHGMNVAHAPEDSVYSTKRGMLTILSRSTLLITV